MEHSAIYKGTIHHCRVNPKSHEFRYRLFMMYLDVDNLDVSFKKSWLWSVNRWNLAYFRRSDFHGDPQIPLREAVQNTVFDQTGVQLHGPVRMLSHLRYFGINFNPVSFYFCYDNAETLRAIVSEVENTPWGERHAYVHMLTPNQKAPYTFSFAKNFHVSPFMPMQMDYRWSFSELNEHLQIKMTSYQEGTSKFYAGLDMKRVPIAGFALDKILLKFPLMTLRVIMGIYWQAFCLYLKKATFYSHPNSGSRVTWPWEKRSSRK